MPGPLLLQRLYTGFEQLEFVQGGLVTLFGDAGSFGRDRRVHLVFSAVFFGAVSFSFDRLSDKFVTGGFGFGSFRLGNLRLGNLSLRHTGVSIVVPTHRPGGFRGLLERPGTSSLHCRFQQAVRAQ